MRVLLIEDEKALSDAICKMLKSEQIVADAAYDGETGLDDALSGIYDAVILDVMLPRLNGFKVLESLRESGSSVPVLMLTARGELEDRLHGLRSGADYYLPKPFRMEELIACLRVITRRKAEVPVMELVFADTELSESTASLINRSLHQAGQQGVPADGAVHAASEADSETGTDLRSRMGL